MTRRRINVAPATYRDLVNSLTAAATRAAGTQQLRANISTALSEFLKADHAHKRNEAKANGTV
jgi:hypothetical protein